MTIHEASAHASAPAVIRALHERMSPEEQQRLIDALQAITNRARMDEVRSRAVDAARSVA